MQNFISFLDQQVKSLNTDLEISLTNKRLLNNVFQNYVDLWIEEKFSLSNGNLIAELNEIFTDFIILPAFSYDKQFLRKKLREFLISANYSQLKNVNNLCKFKDDLINLDIKIEKLSLTLKRINDIKDQAIDNKNCLKTYYSTIKELVLELKQFYKTSNFMSITI